MTQRDPVTGKTRTLQFVGVLALVLVLAVLIGVGTPGYEADIAQGKEWARHFARNGIHEAYRTDVDGAPVIVYAFAAVGWVYQTTIDPVWNERAAQGNHALTVFLKTPPIVAHLGITALLFILAASAHSSRSNVPVIVALAYGANPATLYDAAHFGQTDPLTGLIAALCLAAYSWRSGVLLGIGAAGLLIGKPQGWILLPIIATAAIGRFDLRRLGSAFASGVLTLAIILSPWILSGRAHHFWRYLDNLSGHDISNRVISADAHNVWLVPTLVHGDWVEDMALFIGPFSYRTVAMTLALVWLAYCFIALRRRPAGGLSLVAAAASFGFFMFMTRAHENHSFLSLPLLLCALAVHQARHLWLLFGMISLGLLTNLMLRDPLLMDPYTSVPDMGQESPLGIVGMQLLNVAVFGVALVLMTRALSRTASHGDATVLSGGGPGSSGVARD